MLIEGENVGPEAKRNAETFVITDEQFNSFLKIHATVSQLVPESNTMMRDSYLILDEYVRGIKHTVLVRSIIHKYSSCLCVVRF